VDYLTGLTWEKKDNVNNPANPHYVGNTYTWEQGGGTGANGNAFTDFLAKLNAAPCNFTGYCDWRLPTSAELQTILLEPYRCTTNPCIEPIFGPVGTDGINSPNMASPSRFNAPTLLWGVRFDNGGVDSYALGYITFFRAVRGGM
jgi:hypothetical protein